MKVCVFTNIFIWFSRPIPPAPYLHNRYAISRDLAVLDLRAITKTGIPRGDLALGLALAEKRRYRTRSGFCFSHAYTRASSGLDIFKEEKSVPARKSNVCFSGSAESSELDLSSGITRGGLTGLVD